MKTVIYKKTYYEAGDKLKNLITGETYTFVEYGFCDTAVLKNKKGTHTWGRKFIDDSNVFQFIK